MDAEGNTENLIHSNVVRQICNLDEVLLINNPSIVTSIEQKTLQVCVHWVLAKCLKC